MRKGIIGNRITACLLTFVMIMSCVGVNAADVYTQQDLDGFNENVGLLSAFNLIDKGREAATTIKRGDFAAIMLKYLGYENTFFGDSMFSDVPDKKDPVYSIYSLGLMNGYSDGTFRPNDNISVEQAVTVIVKSLGYEPLAQMRGGYPSGYYSCASQVDLFSKTSMKPDDTLTYFNLVQMLVNALTSELVKSDWRGGFTLSNDTLLSSRLDCEKRKGIVTAAQGVALNESGNDYNNTITLDGIVYEIDGDYSYLIGCYTEYYVNSDDKIIYITEKRTERLEFSSEDIIDYESKTYTVDSENNKGKKYRLSQDSYIIFNGTAADNLTEEDMRPKYGTVTLIDNDNDNKYDVVMVESFDIYVVQNVNKEDKRIYYKNAYGNALEFENIDDGDLTVLNISGQKMGFEQIQVNSVIRVGFDKNNKKAKIIVSTDTVKGTVTQTSKDGMYNVICIDNVQYKLVDEQIDPKTISVGKTGTFYLDSEGMIAYVFDNQNSWSYGYMMSAYIEENGETLGFTIFDSQGKKQYLKGANKVNIDGLKRQQSKQVIELLKKGTDSVVKSVVRYKCNNNGEVKEIDTPYNSASNIKAQPQNGESTDSLRLIYSGKTTYWEQTHNFSGKVNIDNDTILFAMVGEDANEYQIKKGSDIPSEANIMIEAYSDDDNEFYAKLLFSEDRAVKIGGDSNIVIGVVSDVMQGLNADDEPATIIKIRTKHFDKEVCMNTKLAYPFPYNAAQEPIYEPEVGDIVSMKIAGDTAYDVSLIYKHNEHLFPAGEKYLDIGARIHYIYGPIYSYEKGFMNITQKNIELEGIPSMSEIESVRLQDPKIFKCVETGSRKQIVDGTVADIVDYKAAGGSCTKVFLAVEWEYPNIMVIYEE